MQSSLILGESHFVLKHQQSTSPWGEMVGVGVRGRGKSVEQALINLCVFRGAQQRIEKGEK